MVRSLTATALRDRLGLEPHPEGGHYREVYRSAATVPHPVSGEPRAAISSIYFYLGTHDFSAWHSVRSDEIWVWLAGGPVELHQIEPDGTYAFHRLGPAVESYEQQATVPADVWQAARPAPGTAWVLVTCLVAPGFDFADFVMPEAAELLATFPQHADIIRALSRSPKR